MEIKPSSSSASTLLLFLFGISIAISGSFPVQSNSMADARAISQSSSNAGVYIVYTETPPAMAEPESHHLSTLASVLGSEEAAKESLVYVYKNAATGFSAKLTPDQAAQLEKQPGVLQVVPSQTLQLHSGSGMTNMRT